MKTIYTKGILIFSFLIITACSDLDLEPIDNFGSGNFWKKEEQVQGFIYGVHNQIRGQYVNYWLLGEARGGTQKTGNSSIGTSLDYENPIKNQGFTKDVTGISNWAGMYGNILNINLAIQKIENEITFLPDNKKEYYLGQLYGIRAWYYFWMYRTWGKIPINKGIKVLEGVTDPLPLYLKRSSEKEVMDFIKDDINKSETYFGSNTTIQDKSLWSKYATLILKGEIYLWSAKVTTGNQSPATGDLQTAETALNEVYGKFSLLSDFSQVFNHSNKGNAEIIFSLRFLENEASSSFYANFLYPTADALFKGTKYDAAGNLYDDPLDLRTAGGTLRHEYKIELYNSYDNLDKRKNATFLDFYSDASQSNPAVLMRKYTGFLNSTGNRIYTSDIPVYRYAHVLLMLAEIKNKQAADPSAYVNEVRKRAYGADYNALTHGFVNSDFATNELNILKERNKEFVAENCRWFDVRRMQDASGNPLAFSVDANYGSTLSIIPTSEAHKLLWPINVGLLNDDPELEQTEGY